MGTKKQKLARPPRRFSRGRPKVPLAPLEQIFKKAWLPSSRASKVDIVALDRPRVGMVGESNRPREFQNLLSSLQSPFSPERHIPILPPWHGNMGGWGDAFVPYNPLRHKEVQPLKAEPFGPQAKTPKPTFSVFFPSPNSAHEHHTSGLLDVTLQALRLFWKLWTKASRRVK